MSERQLHAAARANALVVSIALASGLYASLLEGGFVGLGALLGVMLIGGFLASRVAQVC
jgi:hypothetical protein